MLRQGTNKVREVKRTIPAETFFTFFNPPQVPAEGEELESDEAEGLDEKLEADYELGEEFKEKIIPHAVDWFTGKALQYEDFEADYYDEEEEDEDDEDEEEEDDDDDDDDVGAAVSNSSKMLTKLPTVLHFLHLSLLNRSIKTMVFFLSYPMPISTDANRLLPASDRRQA